MLEVPYRWTEGVEGLLGAADCRRAVRKGQEGVRVDRRIDTLVPSSSW